MCLKIYGRNPLDLPNLPVNHNVPVQKMPNLGGCNPIMLLGDWRPWLLTGGRIFESSRCSSGVGPPLGGRDPSWSPDVAPGLREIRAVRSLTWNAQGEMLQS